MANNSNKSTSKARTATKGSKSTTKKESPLKALYKAMENAEKYCSKKGGEDKFNKWNILSGKIKSLETDLKAAEKREKILKKQKK